ncbi:MAG: NUDIX hydrolase [Patescibacteria group bacterium]
MIYLSPPENFQPKFYVVSCFIEYDGKFLMLLRNSEKSEGNKWGHPAGKRDEGESEIQAVIREVKEETGIDLDPTQVDRSLPVYIRYPDYDYIFHMFGATLEALPEVQTDPHEHQDHQWVTPEESIKTHLVMDTDACIKAFYGLS